MPRATRFFLRDVGEWGRLSVWHDGHTVGWKDMTPTSSYNGLQWLTPCIAVAFSAIVSVQAKSLQLGYLGAKSLLPVVQLATDLCGSYRQFSTSHRMVTHGGLSSAK